MIVPGSYIEWCCKNPFDGTEVKYVKETFFVWTTPDPNTSVNWREFPAQGLHFLIGMDHDNIAWMSDGRFYTEKLDDLRGGFEFLTGTVQVFPRAVKNHPGGW